MSETTYLESKLEAKLVHEKEYIDIIFHRAKVKLVDELEIHLLNSMNPEFRKEIIVTDDQLIIRLIPPHTYVSLYQIYKKSNQEKWQLVYNLVQKIRSHSTKRLKLFISPENLMYDQGLMPHFLHYGVKESIPPYEDDGERIWNETKATIATIVDQTNTFDSYLSHSETIELSTVTKEIMQAESFDQLIDIINDQLNKDAEFQQTIMGVPKKKWNIQRYSLLALGILLIPAAFLTVYGFFFKIPETEAYVESNRHFLQNQFSSVVETLQGYDEEDMPYSVQYQLATSYVMNESLTEEQRTNVENTITLQSDDRYFLYWIDIGRGDYEEAIDTARLLEDRDLIIYGLLKNREAVKADESLSGDEREQELESIQREIDEYVEEMEEEQKAQEQAEEEIEQTTSSAPASNNSDKQREEVEKADEEDKEQKEKHSSEEKNKQGEEEAEESQKDNSTKDKQEEK
ncbi:type VII secretion protein EssB [Oceanobacillus senegalensis]|uniref:type VII secretion protein EssB n=1 Tax=Oceanobacillus senegalensis TaxID=1936063 RepID=UPI000A314285|nr:type VII secretion protein EssB [Oceanobacillus senegalensis]